MVVAPCLSKTEGGSQDNLALETRAACHHLYTMGGKGGFSPSHGRKLFFAPRKRACLSPNLHAREQEPITEDMGV